MNFLFLFFVQFLIQLFLGENVATKEKMFGHCRVDGICQTFDPEKVDYVLKAREIYVEKNEKLWENFEKMDKSEFEVDGLGMDKKMVAEFLVEEKNAEMFTKMFIYFSQLMDIPMCLTMATVESIAGLNGQQEMAEEYLLSRVKEGARQSRALRRCEEGAKSALGPIAFLFDGTGITEIAVREDGFKCAETLLNPANVAKFIEKIILALKSRENGEEDSFNETVNSVVKTLKNGIEGEKTEIENWIEKLDEKWGKIKIKMEIKKIGNEFKDFAIWLFSASHVEDVIQIILFLSGLARPISISIQTLHIFGIDEMFAEAIEKMGVKIAAFTGATKGPKMELVRWAFGPNGVAPLFVRGGAKAEDEEADKKFEEMMGEQKEKYEERRLARKAEIEFMKKIMEEVIEHKGKPMHELMDHLLGKMGEMEEKVKAKWEEHIKKWEQKWEEIKGRGIKENVKKFAVWLVTPVRVNNVIMLILAITNLSTPVYLTLQTMEAFGISDILLKEMEKANVKMEKFYEKHPKAKGAKHLVEFMISKEGIFPLFLGDGAFSELGFHKQRLSDEADIIEIVADVVTKHGGSPGETAEKIFLNLYEWLLAKVQNKGFYLQIVQRWNKMMEDHHQRLKEAGMVPKKGDFGGTNPFRKFIEWIRGLIRKIHFRPRAKIESEKLDEKKMENEKPKTEGILDKKLEENGEKNSMKMDGKRR